MFSPLFPHFSPFFPLFPNFSPFFPIFPNFFTILFTIGVCPMETFFEVPPGARTIAPGCAPPGAVGPGHGPSHWGWVHAPQAPSERRSERVPRAEKCPKLGQKAWEKHGKMMENMIFDSIFFWRQNDRNLCTGGSKNSSKNGGFWMDGVGQNSWFFSGDGLITNLRDCPHIWRSSRKLLVKNRRKNMEKHGKPKNVHGW